MNDDWMSFDDRRPPKLRQSDPAANQAADLTQAISQAGHADRFATPTKFKQFSPGRYEVICRRAEWKEGINKYLFLVWQTSTDRRGCSIVDPIFLFSESLSGRKYAIQKLSLLAGAAGIELNPAEFKPSDILGASVSIEVAMRRHWKLPDTNVPQVVRYDALDDI